MKKILIIALLLFILVGCKKTNDVPNGLVPLTATSDCDEPTLDGGWTCIWADEFNGTEIDETKWNFEVNGSGGGNNELQYYTRENAQIVDGKLVITAKKESYLGMEYTSSRLTTKYKGSFKYVRMVVRAKMPAGRGTWAAIWMMPLMNAYGGWPDSGELDIMEYVGYEKDRIYSTLHTEKFNHNLGTQRGDSLLISNAETEFHDYELIWAPGYIKTLVDGQKIYEFTYNPAFYSDIPYPESFPFDQEFFLILNLAIGGNWGGSQGIDLTIFPTTFEIDYARVYKLDYATIDEEKPSQPENIILGILKNTLQWQSTTDDFGVEKYAVYIDGQFHRYTNLNQITLTGLSAGQTYQIQVQSVDFTGKESQLSESYSLTYA